MKSVAQISMCVFLAGSVAVLAQTPYLSEGAIRGAIVGQTLDGHYGNGVNWSEAYLSDGGLDYREERRTARGKWSFRPGHVFCTFYDPSPTGNLSGGCWLVVKPSANCFEFYVAGEGIPAESEEGLPAPARWNAQGWRRGEPSTCSEKPAV